MHVGTYHALLTVLSFALLPSHIAGFSCTGVQNCRSVLLRTGSTAAVTAVAPHPGQGSPLVAAGYHNGEVLVWNVVSETVVLSLKYAPIVGVLGLAYSKDGALLAACGPDTSLTIWNSSSGAEVGYLYSPTQNILSSLAFAPDGLTLAAVSQTWKWKKGSVTLFNLTEPVNSRTTQYRTISVEDANVVVYLETGELIIGGTGNVTLWSGTALVGRFAVEGVVSSLAGGGTELLVGCAEGGVMWNTVTRVRQYKVHATENVVSVAVAPSVVVCAMQANVSEGVVVAESVSGNVEVRLGAGLNVSAVAFVDAAATVVTGAVSGELVLWSSARKVTNAPPTQPPPTPAPPTLPPPTLLPSVAPPTPSPPTPAPLTPAPPTGEPYSAAPRTPLPETAAPPDAGDAVLLPVVLVAQVVFITACVLSLAWWRRRQVPPTTSHDLGVYPAMVHTPVGAGAERRHHNGLSLAE